jgi:hypothetical protein
MSKKGEFRFSISLVPEAMTRDEMAELLDFYIAQLREAKELLLSGKRKNFPVRLRKARKPLGRESRAKISAAQRARWARTKEALERMRTIEAPNG